MHWGKDNGCWGVSLYDNAGRYRFQRCLSAELPASIEVQIQIDVQRYNLLGTSMYQLRVMYVTAEVQ
jgi:hypothetical protein